MRTRSRGTKSTVVGSVRRDNPFRGTHPIAEQSAIDLLNQETTVDTLSPFPYIQENPFFSKKEKEGAVIVNGTVNHGLLFAHVGRERFTNYPVGKLIPSFQVASLAPLGSYTSTAIARSAPNQSTVDVGEMAQSMYQMVYMAKQLKKLIFSVRNRTYTSRTIGEAYLLNEFGLTPLIADLWNLVQIARQLQDRAKRYNKAEKGKSFRGKLAKSKDEWKERRWMSTTFSAHSFDVLNTAQYEVWYTIKFIPNGSTAPVTGEERFDLFGADKPLLTLWNLVPWSFLIDYLVDVSDFLGAKYSSHSVRSICIMRHRLATAKVDASSDDQYGFGIHFPFDTDLRFSSRKSKYETKERAIFTDIAFAPIHMILSGGQLANLAALVLARGKNVPILKDGHLVLLGKH